MTLRILTLGTADYLEKFSGLADDCLKFKYEYEAITIPSQQNISEINHRILEHMIEYMETNDFDRLCFMDPECRIIRPIPQQWIDSERPVVFFKVRQEDGLPDAKFTYRNAQGNGERLPCRIIGQPMFLSKGDLPWFRMTLDLARAASDAPNKEFTRNEMFIETALEYNRVDYQAEHIIYNRRCAIKHRAVKGLWTTEDTIVQHPDIFGLFDKDIVAGNPVFGSDPILDKHLIERHTQVFETVEQLNELMFKEKHSEWQVIDNWRVQPCTGKMMFKDLPGVKYHYSIKDKISQGLQTPAVKEFNKTFPGIDLV